MMRGLICAPKVAACGFVLSVWGFIMLAILGICFITHSAVLIEDVPIRKEDTQHDSNPPQKIYELYDKVAVNCFIAAGIYIVLGIFSCCQMTLNRKKKCLKDFFVQRGMLGDHMHISEVNQDRSLSQKDKERDDKINNIIKSIVEKSIADIAKLRQLIALWDAEERSNSDSYIDESSYGNVTQQKIKEYLKDFFNERLMFAEQPKEEMKEESAMSRKDGEGPDSNTLQYNQMVNNNEEVGTLQPLDDSSPIIEKAMSMINQVIQPMVDTIEVTKTAGKTIAKKVRSVWKGLDKDADDTSEDPEAQSVSSSIDDQEPREQSRLAPASNEPASSLPTNKIKNARKDGKYIPPDILDEDAVEELCRFEMQLTPMLSPILEETGDANSSASSANREKMCIDESEYGSRVIATGAARSSAIKNTVPGKAFISEEEETDKSASFMDAGMTGSSLNVMDEKLQDASEEEARKDGCMSQARSTSRLLHQLDYTGEAGSPLPCSSTSSPIIEKARNIISHVIHPVVYTLDSASQVTKTAGKTIVKKVKSIWKSRSGKKKGKRAKGNHGGNTENVLHDGSSNKEDVGEKNEEDSAFDGESHSGISSSEDAELVDSFDDPSSIIEKEDVSTSVSKEEKHPDISENMVVEDFCAFEGETSSGLSTPFLESVMAQSHPTTPASSALEKANMLKNYEKTTPNISEEKTEEVLSCNSIGLSSIPDSKLGATEADKVQAQSGLSLLQSEEDAPEHNIYSIFENIFRQEFSKKLESSLRQGLCDAVRVYVPERSSVESLESAAMTSDLICNETKQSKDEVDSSSMGLQDSPETGTLSVPSSCSYQLLEGKQNKKHSSEPTLQEEMQPGALNSRRKSLWKRWKMSRSRKIRPNLLDGGCCPGSTLDMATDSQATKPAITSILNKVKSIWK
nr:uncharacterized protein LOC131125903 isoform X2 [Doryrhamphus excisus]